jgi:ABC-type transport system involved in multi-copper enzyme maturation permease subunit
MIWLTWRQFRAQAITAVAALAAFAILLATTEPSLSSMYNSSGLLTCHGGTCAGLAGQFLQNLTGGGSFLFPGASVDMVLYFLGVLVILIAPAVTGCFWGAPLIARELEAGTFRLAWNQSVTRTRWLTVKLTLTGAAAMAVTEAFSLLQAWWAAPIGKAVGLGGSSSIFSETRFGWFVFPTHGITPLGYAAFGFALGVTAGLVIRRPIPAMAITLAVFAAVQFITPLWIRPHLFPTSRTVTTIAAAGANVSLNASPRLAVTASVVPGQPGAWIMPSEGINAAGQPVSTIPASCEQAVPDALGVHRGTTVAQVGQPG